MHWVDSPAFAILGIFVFTFVGAAAVGITTGIPRPMVHDEFSYLLAGDTFAHGRVSNPPLDNWQHFESPHIIQRPTYASKYPPVQGAILALGARLGRPIFGVWLSAAAFCAATTWMLMGCLPRRWAVVGGFLCALNFGMAGLWAQSYWGGAVAALGGALLVGSTLRLDRRPEWTTAVVFAIALLILAFSRPYEGLVLSAFAATGLVSRRLRSLGGRGLSKATVTTVVAGTICVLAYGAYNRSVTGRAMQMPYQLHSRTYDAAPLFLFQSLPAEPKYSSSRLRQFHVQYERGIYLRQQSLDGWFDAVVARIVDATTSLCFGPPRVSSPRTWPVPGLLLLPVLLLPFQLRRARPRRAWIVISAFFASLTAVTYFIPHYLAPVAAVWTYLVLDGLRGLRAIIADSRARATVVPAVLLISVAQLLGAARIQFDESHDHSTWTWQRARLEESLLRCGARHLVLVQYSPDYNLGSEWVYNSSNLATQPIVWARMLNEESDRRLIDAQRDRSSWRLYLAKAAEPDLELISVAQTAGDVDGARPRSQQAGAATCLRT